MVAIKNLQGFRDLEVKLAYVNKSRWLYSNAVYSRLTHGN